MARSIQQICMSVQLTLLRETMTGAPAAEKKEERIKITIQSNSL